MDKPKKWTWKEWRKQYRSKENFSSLESHMVADMLLCSAFMSQEPYINHLESLLKEARAVIEKREDLIEQIYRVCLCERFKTKGFDYGEKHPNCETESGSRLNTPRDLIESWVGYDWSEGGRHPKILKTRSFLDKNKDKLKGVEDESKPL